MIPGSKNKENKADFPVLYKKNEKLKNGVMGSSPSIQHARTYNSFREELATLTLLFKSAKLRKHLPKQKKRTSYRRQS